MEAQNSSPQAPDQTAHHRRSSPPRSLSTQWVPRLLLLGILLLGGYFRMLNLHNWDGGTLQHPDERFLVSVTSRIHLPDSLSTYFDAARSPANPQNVMRDNEFFIYGIAPPLLTRLVAVMLTPPEALSATEASLIARPDGSTTPSLVQRANAEQAYPRAPPVLQNWLNPNGENMTRMLSLVRIGRTLAVLFDIGSLLLVYLLGKALYGRRVGLLAALLAALTVLHIQQAHFFVDPSFSTFFTLLALYWAVRVAQGGSLLTIVLLGISIGMAMATRITLAALGIVALVALLQNIHRWRLSRQAMGGRLPSFFHHTITRGLPLLVLIGFLAFFSFRVLQPYAFVGSTPTSPPIAGQSTTADWMAGKGLLDIRIEPRYFQDLKIIRELNSGEEDYPPSHQWVNRTDYLYPLQNFILWGMGPLAGIVAWVGWLLVGYWHIRHWLTDRGSTAACWHASLVLWVWVGFYFLWQGGQFAVALRYMLPITAPLLVFAARLLIGGQGQRMENAVQGSGVRSRGAGVMGRRSGVGSRESAASPPSLLSALRSSIRPALLLLVVVGTLAWAYAFTRIYTRPHPRLTAARWIAQQAPPGATLAHEWWDDPLPLEIDRRYEWAQDFPQIKLTTYAQDIPVNFTGGGMHNLQGLLDQLEQAQYLTLTSSRVYNSIKQLPMRYPVTMRFYHELFEENLGFELVADITSYPSILGISIPDQQAEESFHVYDHPRVLIFRKTSFSRAQAEAIITEHANWDEVYVLPVGIADQAPTALRLTEENWQHYHTGGTWSALFAQAGQSDILAALRWFLTLEILGLATFALLFRWLPQVPDGGFSLARTLALALVAWGAWMLGSLHVLPFTPQSVWVCATPLLIGGVWAAIRSRQALVQFWREQRTALLTAEAVYLLAFLLLLLIRWLNPDLWHPWRGGEKPMEFAYLNAILQSAAFPPYDPWFAGGTINYYYFGFVLVGALIHLTGIIPAVAFNLAVPTIFALTALGAWGVVYNLLAGSGVGGKRMQNAECRMQNVQQGDIAAQWLQYSSGMDEGQGSGVGGRGSGIGGQQSAVGGQRAGGSNRHSLLAAVLAPIAMLLLGNLVQAQWFLNGYAAEQSHRPEWAFWDATRIVAGTVNEFPFFTFLFADMHPHMIVMPFSLCLLGLTVALARLRPDHLRFWTDARFLLFILMGFMTGLVRATNTWDYPTYLGLTLLTIVLLHSKLYQRMRRRTEAPLARTLLVNLYDPGSAGGSPASGRGLAPPNPYLITQSPPLPTESSRGEGFGVRALSGEKTTLLVQVLFSLLVACGLVVGVGSLLFAPFLANFATESSGLLLLRDRSQEGLLQQVWLAERTNVRELLLIHGHWLFIVASAGFFLFRRWLRLRWWQSGGLVILLLAVTIWGITHTSSAPLLLLPLLTFGVLLLWQLRRLPLRAVLPLWWALTALAICLGIEIVVVRGDVGRMNTVFKFGLHAWTLFALSAAVAIPWMWRSAKRKQPPSGQTFVHWFWRLALVVLLLAALVYPITATPSRIADRYDEAVPHTLNGMAFFHYVSGNEQGTSFPLDEEYAAIQWLQEHIVGTPLILEAHQPSYRWGARIATYTGLPTLLGWEWHQRQQRSVVETRPLIGWEQAARPHGVDTRTVIERRKDAIATMYNTPDAMQAWEMLSLYGIEYVYVGGVEHAIYAAEGIAKFTELANLGYLTPVFEQGATTIYRVEQTGEPTVLTVSTPVDPPDDEDTTPALMLNQPVNMLPAMHGFAWNDWVNASSLRAVLVWLIIHYGLLLLGIPLALVLFRNWHDCGIVWARLLSLLVIGYIIWMPTSLGTIFYSQWSVGASILVMVLLDGIIIFALGRSTLSPNPSPIQDSDGKVRAGTTNNTNNTNRCGGRDVARNVSTTKTAFTIRVIQGEGRSTLSPLAALRAGWRVLWQQLWQRRRAVLMSEGVFLLGFALFTLIRAYNPDLWHPIWGGEKPMEFGFLNALTRSPVMPPYSPFFSDGSINYYYYGFFLMSLPIKMSGIAPAFAFNLIIPTLFALTLVGSYAIVRQLTGKVRYGLAGAAFLALLGNLASVFKVGWSQGFKPVREALFNPANPEPFWERVMKLGQRIGDWYIGPSRVVTEPAFTINEFPFWSFLYADLHPHLIAMPITLLMLALAYQVLNLRRFKSHPLLFLFVALTLGTLAVTNSWDFPTYVLLTLAVLVGNAWRRAATGLGKRLMLMLGAAVLAGGLAVGGMLLYAPFFEAYHAMVSGIGTVKMDDAIKVREYLIIHGLFIAVLLPMLMGAAWRLMGARVRRRRKLDVSWQPPVPIALSDATQPGSTAATKGAISVAGRVLIAAPFVATLVAYLMRILRPDRQADANEAFPQSTARQGKKSLLLAALPFLLSLLPLLLDILRKRSPQPASPAQTTTQTETQIQSSVESSLDQSSAEQSSKSTAFHAPFARIHAPFLTLLGRLALLLTLFLLARVTVQLPELGLRFWMGGLFVIGMGMMLARQVRPTTWFIFLLTTLAWSIMFGVETIFIRDHLAGGSYYRMNTVFKFGLQMWVLLAIAAAAGLPLLMRGMRRVGRGLVRMAQRAGSATRTWSSADIRLQQFGGKAAQAVALLLLTPILLMSAIFPLAGTPSRVANRFAGSEGLTLDGLAFMHYGEFEHEGNHVYLKPDGEAIDWLNEHITGTPVVVQSGLWFYRTYGIRVAANTGLPTVVSALHENEQRDPALVGKRDSDVETLFRTTDGDTALQILQKYRVNYVYVGSIEHAFYPAEGLAKFDTFLAPFLEVVYENAGVRIYHVKGSPQRYAALPPIRTSSEEETGEQPPVPTGPIPRDMAVLEQEPTETLEHYLEIAPTHSEVAIVLARRYQQMNRISDALHLLERAALANPQNIFLQHVWGDMLASIQRYDEAEEVYREAALTSMKSADWDKLGRELIAWGRLDKAEIALVRALTIEPVDPAAYYHLGQTYHLLGEPEKASKYLEMYLSIEPAGVYSDAARELLGE